MVQIEGHYANADELYGQAVAQQPHGEELVVALVHTWLHEGELAQAVTGVNRLLAEHPQSAPTLVASAEVQFRQGQPWLAMQTLDSAAAVAPCYARTHLIRSRVFRIDSKYASERTEIESAYAIDPNDGDIRRAWLHTVSPAHDIVSIEQSLASTKDIDPKVQMNAEEAITSMMRLLSENSQTRQVLPTATSATLPLLTINSS